MKDAECADRKKNHISDFSDFHSSSYGHFCTKNGQFSMNLNDKSENKNRKIDFLFDSTYCASFMKVGSKLRRREGLHILSWDRAIIEFYMKI